jgi:hypothetical protein
MNNQISPVFFLVLLPLFPVLWYFVGLKLSRIGGWQKLAEVYPARTPPSGQKFNTYGAVGKVRYKGCLYVFVSRDGLFVSVMALFSIGHKPLFLPWSVIHNKQSKKILWHEMVEFDIGYPCIATMQLPKKIFESEYAMA